MQKYLQFLLQFMLRNSGFSELPDFAALGLDSFAVRMRDQPLTETKVKVVGTKNPGVDGRSTNHQDPTESQRESQHMDKKRAHFDPNSIVYEVVTIPDIKKTWK